jgi:Tfp pilus assembly protein PilV
MMNSKGFTLVETLVAAIVVVFSVIAVIAMARTGVEQMSSDRHRRAARGVIERTLESQQFQPENYNGLITVTTPTPQDVVIDARANNRLGSLTVSIGVEASQAAGAGTVPYRAVVATVKWTEIGNENGTYNGRFNTNGTNNDSVVVTKWLTKVQRQ